MHIFENEITLGKPADHGRYARIHTSTRRPDCRFPLCMWRNINLFQWDIIGDYMCVTGLSHLELEDRISLPFLFPPLTGQNI